MNIQFKELCKTLGFSGGVLKISSNTFGDTYNFNYLAKILIEHNNKTWDDLLDEDIIGELRVIGNINLKSDYNLHFRIASFENTDETTIKQFINDKNEFANLYIVKSNFKDLKTDNYATHIENCKIEKLDIKTNSLYLHACKINELVIDLKEADGIEFSECEIEKISFSNGSSLKDFKGDFDCEKNGVSSEDFSEFYLNHIAKDDEDLNGAIDLYNSGLFSFKQK